MPKEVDKKDVSHEGEKKENEKIEEKPDNNKGVVSLDILLSCLHFYFSRMEMMINEPKRKNSSEFTEGEKMEEAKERAEYLTIRVETLT